MKLLHSLHALEHNTRLVVDCMQQTSDWKLDSTQPTLLLLYLLGQTPDVTTTSSIAISPSYDAPTVASNTICDRPINK